ncbi:MAG: hypothetical protein PF482_15975 [Desulfobacteraceae bacterium]|nr:hypothetical protein [Desulfobacteraceae bacterium]
MNAYKCFCQVGTAKPVKKLSYTDNLKHLNEVLRTFRLITRETDANRNQW